MAQYAVTGEVADLLTMGVTLDQIIEATGMQESGGEWIVWSRSGEAKFDAYAAKVRAAHTPPRHHHIFANRRMVRLRGCRPVHPGRAGRGRQAQRRAQDRHPRHPDRHPR